MNLRAVLVAMASTTLWAVACSSSSPNATPQGTEGACGDGYLTAVNGTCPKGTCLVADASAACCGSQCATCEEKGLVSLDEAGACPPGTCVSVDVTVELSCCDTCPGGADAGSGSSSGGDASGAETASPPGDASEAAQD